MTLININNNKKARAAATTQANIDKTSTGGVSSATARGGAVVNPQTKGGTMGNVGNINTKHKGIFDRLVSGVKNQTMFCSVKTPQGIVKVDADVSTIEILTKVGTRNVSWEGQETRALHLLELVNEGGSQSAIQRVAISLAKWNESPISVRTFIYKVKDRNSHLTLEGGELIAGPTVNVYRRDGLWRPQDVEVVQIIDGSKISSLDDIEEDAKNGTLLEKTYGKGVTIGTDDGDLYELILSEVFSKYRRKTFLGGNAQSGILLFGNNSHGINSTDHQNLLRWGKILLRGGIKLNSGSNISAKLVRFPEEVTNPEYRGGYRDGIFAIGEHQTLKQLAKANGLMFKGIWQSTFYNGISAMKGLIVSPFTMGLDRLLGKERMVISLEDYNKVFSANKKAGDFVVIQPGDIWVMAGNTKMQKDVHISGQSVRRAPDELKAFLADENYRLQKEMLDALSEGKNVSNYLPNFGIYSKIKATGLLPFGTPIKNDANRIIGWGPSPKLDRFLQEDLVRANKKGFKVPGLGGYLIHRSDLSIGDANGIPEISVGKSSGLAVGDYVIFLRYPILDAKDDQERSGGIFVARIVEVTDIDYIGLHPQVVLFAMGDEDGDQPLLIPVSAANVDQYDLLKCGVGHIDVAALVKGIGSKVYPHPFMAFATTGGNVGVVSNRVEGFKLYLEDAGIDPSDVETPSGDKLSIYLGACEQHPISSMKHDAVEVYAWNTFKQWSVEFFNDLRMKGVDVGAIKDGKYGPQWVKHPELEAQKPGLIKPVIEDVKELLSYEGGAEWSFFMRGVLSYKLNPTGFVRWDYYTPSIKRFYKALSVFIESKDTRENLARVISSLEAEYNKILLASGSDAAASYMEWRVAELKLTLLPAEWIFAQLVVMANSVNVRDAAKLHGRVIHPYTWLKFCDVTFLRAFVKFTEERSEDEGNIDVGINGRNKIRANKSYDLDMSSGLLTVRAYSSDPMSFKKGDTVIAKAARDIGVAKLDRDVIPKNYIVVSADYYVSKVTGIESDKSMWLTLREEL